MGSFSINGDRLLYDSESLPECESMEENVNLEDLVGQQPFDIHEEEKEAGHPDIAYPDDAMHGLYMTRREE